MALLDICITEGDNRISQEEFRGNIGVLTDVNIAAASQVSEEIPLAAGGENGFGYAS